MTTTLPADAPAPAPADRDALLVRALAERIDARDPGALNNFGVLCFSKGRYADAVDAFRRALAISPRMRTASRNLAIVAQRRGACEPHIEALEARLAHDAHDREARRDLAQLLRLLGRRDEAQRHLAALLDADPDDARTLVESGLLEQQSGDLERADRWFERALALEPDDPVAQFHLAEVAYQRGQNARALALTDALLTQDDAHADAHQLRSFILGDMGQHEAALEASAAARALNPALASVRADLMIDETAAAPADASPMPSNRSPDDDIMPAIPSEWWMGTGATASASTASSSSAASMLGVVDGGTLARYSLGLAFRQRGYWREARREFERALAMDADAPLVRHALAELDLVEGRTADAIARYETLLAERTDDARLWTEHGAALHQQGQVAAAAESYRRALRADPHHALAYHNLGIALDALGEHKAAREALQRAASLDVALLEARLNLARFLRRDGDGRGALALLRELTDFHAAHADALYETAVTHRALAQGDAAHAAVVRAIEASPDHAEARYLYAAILAEAGDEDGALRETQRALALAPVRRDRGASIVIALQHECPDTAGHVDLLRLSSGTPLVGTAVSAESVASMLEAAPVGTPVAATVGTRVGTSDASGTRVATDAATDVATVGAADAAAPGAGDARDTATDAATDDATDAATDAEAATDPLADATAALAAGEHARARTLAGAWLASQAGAATDTEDTLARATLLVADGFAADGLHGEARERYEQIRRLGDATRGRVARPDARSPQWRHALLGEVRSACLLDQGAQVISQIERLGAHATDDVEVLALLAACYASLGDAYGHRTALAAVQRFLARSPRSAALLHFVGDAATRLDEPALALTCYRHALALDPSRPTPRLAVARALMRRGDLLAARLELVAALALVPGWRDAVTAMADLHLQAGRPREAVAVLAQHLARTPGDAALLAHLADALLADGRVDDARHAVQRARRLDADEPRALLLDGRLLAAQGRVRDARSRWGRLLAMHPHAPSAAIARNLLADSDAELRELSLRVAPTVPVPAAPTRRTPQRFGR